MKKEITNLIESEIGTLKINNFCTLNRWKKDMTGEEVDHLDVSFNLTHSFSHTFKIKARDWRGIVAEVQEAQTKAFAAAAEELNKQLENGYIG